MSRITKKMSLLEVVKQNPKAVEILTKHGMHCIGCQMAMFETLEQGCKAHGMSDNDISKIIKELNKKKKGD